jgi:hypothetical protein
MRTALRNKTMKILFISLLGFTLAAPGLAEADKGVDANRVIQFEQAPFQNYDSRSESQKQPKPAVLAQNDARGMEFDVYIRLQTGMSEGELLARAGKPDSESVENVRNDIVKTYYYLPTRANPWITAITLRGGKIANIDRTKKIF